LALAWNAFSPVLESKSRPGRNQLGPPLLCQPTPATCKDDSGHVGEPIDVKHERHFVAYATVLMDAQAWHGRQLPGRRLAVSAKAQSHHPNKMPSATRSTYCSVCLPRAYHRHALRLEMEPENSAGGFVELKPALVARSTRPSPRHRANLPSEVQAGDESCAD
jgi:hypothetical protein